ncbi:MAG: YitT family protein [Lachnospiraceae bacterium]|nr:YitT family protein [Lachnospiraceae bacterium]
MRKSILSPLIALSFRQCVLSLAGSIILAFGLYHIHAQSGITEGGVLGMTLLLQYHFAISPSVSGFLLNAVCYFIGWRFLGKRFLFYSAVAALGFSASYRIFEFFPPLWPAAADHPFLAAMIGAVFIGVGAGLSVRAGGAPSGDDALAMAVSKATRMQIQWAYLISDLLVLALSLTYIPLSRILYSLLTVVLSGQIIGWIQNINIPRRKNGQSSLD